MKVKTYFVAEILNIYFWILSFNICK